MHLFSYLWPSPGDKKEDASLKEGRYVAVEDAGTLYRGFHFSLVLIDVRYSILFGNELTRSLLEITQTVPMIVVGILHLILMDIALAFRKGNPIDLARDTRICRDRKQPFFPTGQGRRLEILPVLDISFIKSCMDKDISINEAYAVRGLGHDYMAFHIG
ncbi:hypothetical protein ACJX0J_036143 [Zea mays]